jgi:hypothetical protein
VWMGYRLIRARDFPWQSTVVLAACLVSTVAVALITAAALPEDGKVNNHIYPGYIIFLAPVWVMVGLAGLRRAPWRVAAGTTGTAVALALVSWFVVESYTRPIRPIGKPHVFSPIDAPEVLFLVGDWNVVHLARVTAITVGLIIVVGAALMLRRLPQLAVLVLLGAVAVNVSAQRAATEQMALIAREQDGPRLVRDAHVRPGAAVACDVRLVVRFNHQREVYWRPLVDVDLSRADPPAEVDVVVGPWYTGNPRMDWDGAAHGWQFVTGDRLLTWALWRRPGT